MPPARWGPRLLEGGVIFFVCIRTPVQKEILQFLSLYHTGYLNQTGNPSGKNNYIVLGIHPWRRLPHGQAWSMVTGFGYGRTPKAGV